MKQTYYIQASGRISTTKDKNTLYEAKGMKQAKQLQKDAFRQGSNSARGYLGTPLAGK